MLHHDERLIVETAAKMVWSKKKLSGRLILTSKRLFFWNENLQAETAVPLNLIDGMKEYKIWGLFSKGILIQYLSNTLLILVDYPKDWLKIIERQVNEFVI